MNLKESTLKFGIFFINNSRLFRILQWNVKRIRNLLFLIKK